MTERDWRIFREDFNIQYKGNTDILPIRSWDEAKMPQELRKVGKGSTSTCFPVSCWTVIWLITGGKRCRSCARQRRVAMPY